MKRKLEDLIKNPEYDQEDEYRDPMEDRLPAYLIIISVLAIGLVFYALYLLTTYCRAL